MRPLAGPVLPDENRGVPEPESPVARKVAARRAARQAERRRTAVTALQIAEATCRYGTTQLNGSGIGPEEARLTALEVAGELTAVADILRRVVRLTRGERRKQAALLTSRGWSRRKVADQLGCSERTVHRDLASTARAQSRA